MGDLRYLNVLFHILGFVILNLIETCLQLPKLNLALISYIVQLLFERLLFLLLKFLMDMKHNNHLVIILSSGNDFKWVKNR